MAHSLTNKGLLKKTSPPARVLAWIRANELSSGGIRVHSEHDLAYPEVTGYTIPTILQLGEKDLASRLTRWLICVQRGDGSFPSPEGVPHIFDTGQVLRGLLAMSDRVDGALQAIERAAQYLIREMTREGSGGFGPRYDGTIPETVHLYVLPPLMAAGEVLSRPEYEKPVERCLEYYQAHPDFLRVTSLTHYLGYELEALIDLGRADLAAPILERLCREQNADGSIPGMEGVKWICVPGLAQLAVCLYKTGRWKAADKALQWLDSHQRPSGGFPGSCKRGANYFPHVEIPWAAKFYLDAHLLRVASFFERNAATFPASIPSQDGRLQAVLRAVKPKDRILEVGCGKGRFLKAVHQIHPETQCTGVDISPALLEYLPDGIRAVQGPMESIPLPDDCFDVVFSVEAIEHSANLEAAVSEMIRVARPGGWILVIDKPWSQWGRLRCPPWERWPEMTELNRLLNKWCDSVKADPVGYDGKPASDGLMLVWRGRKRSPLSGSQWHETLISPLSHARVVRRVKGNQLSEWAQAVLLATSPGERVLEVGCGTGEISVHLAYAGREVAALDVSKESLGFLGHCGEELGLVIEKVVADAMDPLPFRDNSFDCVWSSGLLEHFTAPQRIGMLREQARITRGQLISIVPNAACVAYRAGKAYQEERGEWSYGLETPLLSMRQEFEAAGVRVVSEYSVGARHALSFLPNTHPIHHALSRWFDELSPEELVDCHQGYLLVTIGRKTGRNG